MAQRWFRRKWRPLLAAGLATCLLGVEPQTNALTAPLAVAALGLDDAAAAALRSLATVALALTVALSGHLGSRWGERRLLLVGAALLLAGSLLGAAAPGGATLLLSRAVAGTGLGLLFGAGLSVLALNYRGAALTLASSLWLVMDAAAVLVSGPAAGVIVHAFGWRSGPLMSAALALLVGVACAVLLSSTRVRRARLRWTVFSRLMTHPGFAAGAIVGVAFNFMNGFALAAYPILGFEMGLPGGTVGLVTSLIGAGSVVGAVAAGAARARWRAGTYAMYLTGLAALAAAAVVQLLTSHEHTVAAPLMGALVLGAAVMWIQQPQSEVMIALAGPAGAGAVAPLKTLLGQLGMAAGLAAAAPTMGALEAWGPVGAYGLGSAAMSIVPCLCAVVMLVLARAERGRGGEPRAMRA